MSTDADILKSLSDLIVRDGESVRLRRSQYIVRRGERPQSLFLIREGWAARYRILRDGRRHISQFYTPGDVCDSSWLLSGEAGHSVLALTPLRGVALDREAAELRFGRDAEFSRRVASESLSRLEAQAEWMVTLGCKSARERLGQLILELYLRLERAGRAADWRCEFPLSQQHLADFTGMTAVHVCRTLRGLRREQLADVHGRKLSILDFPALARASSFESGYLACA